MKWALPVILGAALMLAVSGTFQVYRDGNNPESFDVDCYGSARYQAMADNLPTCHDLALAELQRREGK